MIGVCPPALNKNNGEQKKMGLNVEYNSSWVMNKGQEDGGACFSKENGQKNWESAGQVSSDEVKEQRKMAPGRRRPKVMMYV